VASWDINCLLSGEQYNSAFGLMKELKCSQIFTHAKMGTSPIIPLLSVDNIIQVASPCKILENYFEFTNS
jgi:hypothetical protein